MSSSCAKPCVHHTVAAFAAGLAIQGCAIAPAATSPKEPRITERLVGFVLAASFLFPPQNRSGRFYNLIATIKPITRRPHVIDRAIGSRGGNTTTGADPDGF